MRLEDNIEKFIKLLIIYNDDLKYLEEKFYERQNDEIHNIVENLKNKEELIVK